jgi:hypothetical protein
MAKKLVKRKKAVKVDPLAYEKGFLSNGIKLFEKCASENERNDLGKYFQSKADFYREELKKLK